MFPHLAVIIGSKIVMPVGTAGMMRSVEVCMSDMTKESLDVLEDWLKADKSINPKDAPRLQKLLADTPIKDVIALVERHNAVRAALALRLLPRQRSIEVFDALDSAHQADLIDELGNTEVFEFFDELDPDDRVSLLDELPAEIADRLLRSLDQDERDVTGVVLGYPKGSIGRRMSPQVPEIYREMTVDEALARVRETADNLETIYTLPVTRKDRRLVGVISFRTLFTARGNRLVEDLMSDPVFAYAHDDAEETARWFMPLDFLAMPIVDESTRLVGILTWDDAADIVE